MRSDRRQSDRQGRAARRNRAVPQAFLDPIAAEIRLLCDHRDTVIVEKTSLTNELRLNLLILDPELGTKVRSRKLDYPGQLRRISRRTRSMPQSAKVRIAREQVRRITTVTREAETLKRELCDLIRQHHPSCSPRPAAARSAQRS